MADLGWDRWAEGCVETGAVKNAHIQFKPGAGETGG
jgi:hypothetical protein